MNLSISRDGSVIGAWPEEQVRTLYTEGQLLPTDYYWRSKTKDWKQLGTFIRAKTVTPAATGARPSIRDAARSRRRAVPEKQESTWVKTVRRGVLSGLLAAMMVSFAYLVEKHLAYDQSATILAYSITGLISWCAVFFKSEASLSRVTLWLVTAAMVGFLVLPWINK